MNQYRPLTTLDKIFEGGVVIKGLNGLVELLTALVLFFVSPARIQGVITFATQKELREDPHDAFANFLIHAAQHINFGSKWFAIIYLTIHGAVKLTAVIGILKNQLWAYPFSLITLGILTLYQFYSIYIRPSAGMVVLTIFDIFILWLIWREYCKVTRKKFE